MIRLAEQRHGPQVLALANAWPVVGTLVGMHWRMKQQNSRLPHRFYLVGAEGLVKLSGGRATLCGHVEDAEELGAFLRLEGSSQMTALGFVPPQWKLVEADNVMVRRPAAAPSTLPRPEGFDGAPSAEDVIGVLESADGPISPKAARDYLYADYNARRNHGMAQVYGIRREGELVATAGAWALTEDEGYIACVETRPEHRRCGHATALLGRLCGDFGARPLSLMCRGDLAPFYARFGFEKNGLQGLISIDNRET